MATEEFDIAQYLDNDEIIAEYLSVALEEGDPAFFNSALGDVVRERGLSQIANETGLSRMGLYKSFLESGNPTLSSLQKIFTALNLKLTISPATKPSR